MAHKSHKELGLCPKKNLEKLYFGRFFIYGGPGGRSSTQISIVSFDSERGPTARSAMDELSSKKLF